jgi:hypothetical protein
MNGRPRHLEHGHAALQTRTYRIWKAMRTRCTNPRQRMWHRYGGRGIKICRRWDNFKYFLADMGECPPGLTLERVDRDGDYKPSNCVWATYQAQRINSARHTLTWDDVRAIRAIKGRSQESIADEYGVHQTAISAILRNQTWRNP